MKLRNYLMGAAALAAATLPTSSWAVDNLIVTVQRRAEDQQSVPVAVSAFGAPQIEKRQINILQDIATNVPNFQMNAVTANASALQLHMRGASIQSPGLNTSEAPVGIYEDGVYRGRLASANLDLADIERIEVLRGPQGTLYGRNTIAGALKVISRTPGDDFYLNGSAGYGNYETFKLTAALGGPIQEGNLAASAAITYHDRDKGYFTQVGSGDNQGKFNNFVGRGKLHWYGNDNLDAVLTVWGVDVTNDGYNGVPFIGIGPGSMPAAGGFFNINTSFDNSGATKQWGLSLDGSWDINGNTTLRSITSYSDIQDKFAFDLQGGVAPGVAGTINDSDSDFEQFTQEVQLVGDILDGDLEYLLGVYYLHEKGSQTFGQLFGGGPTIWTEDTTNKTDSIAIFGQFTYNLTDRLSLTAGARWTRDDKDFTLTCTTGVGSAIAGAAFMIPGGLLLPCSFDPKLMLPPIPVGGSISVALSEVFTKATPMGGIDFQVTDDILLYANASTGFQAGGFQNLCFANVTCASETYRPQTVLSTEAGIKTDWFDNMLRVNLAGFYAMYKDIQNVIPSGGAFPTQNIGEVDVWGVELEVYASPLEGLNLFGLFGYADNEYGTIDPSSQVAFFGATELPQLPEFTFKVGFDYEHAMVPINSRMGTDLKFKLGLDYYYSDDFFSEASNLLPIESYGRLNGFVGFGAADDSWDVVAAGRNLTNENDFISGISVPGLTNIRTALPPREWMVTLHLRF